MEYKKWDIFGGDYIDELDRRILSNRVLWFIVFVLTGTIFLLMVSYHSLSEKVSVKITIPPYEREYEASYDWANREFFDLWGTYISSQIQNFDKSNIDEKLAILVSKMLPDVYLKNKTKFEALSVQTKKNALEFHFVPSQKTSIEVSSDKKTAVLSVSGIANKIISGEPQPPKNCHIQMNLNYIGGNVYVSNIDTNCI